MTSEEIFAQLKAAFGDDVGALSEAKLDPFATVKADSVVDVCRWLKQTPGIELDHCDDITAVDQPKRNVIEIVYHLFSYAHRHGLVLKAEVDRAAPALASVEPVWKAANWLEREIYDLMGVEFRGHPDMRRILLPDDWVGHPLRKDYQEAGGYHAMDNQRPDPLVRLRQADEAVRAANPKPAAPAPAPAPAAPAPAAAAPAAAAPTPAAAVPAPATPASTEEKA